jgi:osmotically-inducible protein OsmY
MRLFLSSLMTLSALFVAASVGGEETASDARIEAAFRGCAFARHPVAGDRIRAASKDGVVTLTGSVAAASRRAQAERAASAQAGVRNVYDLLTVDAPGPAAGTDAELRLQVKRVLALHLSVEGLETGVDVHDGVVTLSGRFDDPAERSAAARYALGVAGVASVRNELVVAPPPRPSPALARAADDAALTSAVEFTLHFRDALRTRGVRVQTTEGVVTLAGAAESAAARDAAGRIAAGVPGVLGVRNELSVP